MLKQVQHDITKEHGTKLNLQPAEAYNSRGIAYYYQKQYDKAWDDIKKAQDSGFQIPPKFLDDLGKASGSKK